MLRRSLRVVLVLEMAACSTTPGGAGGASPSDAGPTDGTTHAETSAPDAPADALRDASVDSVTSDVAPPVDAAADVPNVPDAAAATLAHARADSAVEAMLLAYWDPSSAYLDATQGATGLTGYWTFAQAWDAVLDAVQRHGDQRFTGTLRTFYDCQDAAGWSSDYYDDETWMTLALVRAFDLTADATYLTQAESLYADIMAAWDTTCCGATPGGIWWDRAHTQKATASNAGPVLAGARLYERTQNQTYLTFAQQAYAYWSASMVDPTSYHVYDHISSAGALNTTWTFTYNEGLMIGACVELAKASGTTAPLQLATSIAGFVQTGETESSAAGLILTDGSDTSCTGDCEQFKGIAARYLAALYAAEPSQTQVLGLVDRSADAAWTIARDPSSGLFGADWGAPFASPALLDATSSAAMTLAVAAELQGPAPPDAPNVYEAEEGVLHDVGLEATYGAFDGWGYVAGWNADGQWVDFLVTAPSAGTYDLTFRYAAGAGDASRYLYVDGATAVQNLALASTTAWDDYATATATVALTAGANTVSLIYDSSMGSTGYVNLDQLVVAPH